MESSADNSPVKPGIADDFQISDPGNSPAIIDFPAVCPADFIEHRLIDAALRSYGTDVEKDAPLKIPVLGRGKHLHRIVPGGYNTSLLYVYAQAAPMICRQIAASGGFGPDNIHYMLTGSVASSLYGEPRSTHDIDVVVALTRSSARTLREAFPSTDFYLTEESIISAIDEKGMFNLIDATEGDKVDFRVLTDEPFDQSRFDRRRSEEVMGISVRVSSPEDTILAKLKWAKDSGGSEKHFISLYLNGS